MTSPIQSLGQTGGEASSFLALGAMSGSLEALALVVSGVFQANSAVTPEEEEWLERVSKNGVDLQHASETLKKNARIVAAAVNQNPRALRYASIEQRGNKKIVLPAVMQHGPVLEFASKELQDDEETATAAALQNFNALRYAGIEQRGNKKIVLPAVMRHGPVIEFASEELQDDEETATAAVLQNVNALRYVGMKQRGNKKLFLAVLERNPAAFNHVPQSLKSDNDFLLELSDVLGERKTFALLDQFHMFAEQITLGQRIEMRLVSSMSGLFIDPQNRDLSLAVVLAGMIGFNPSQYPNQ